MKDNSEISRINYANAKHHRQLLREQIDPQLISQLQHSSHPSRNYQDAFKGLYMDELEKTLQYHQEKKQQKHLQGHPHTTGSLHTNLPQLMRSSSHMGPKSKVYRPVFTDYDQERSKKFDELINKGYNGGRDFFNSQEKYQKQKFMQSILTRNCLQQQLSLNNQKREKQNQSSHLASQEIKMNRMRQMEEQREKNLSMKKWKVQERQQIQAMIEKEHVKRQKKSIFNLGVIGRHNPITNPIEYHIDNPYILQKIQKKCS